MKKTVKKKAYKVDLNNGCVTIVMAMDIETATEWACAEYGRMLSPQVTKALQEDIDWVKAMNGCINEL